MVNGGGSVFSLNLRLSHLLNLLIHENMPPTGLAAQDLQGFVIKIGRVRYNGRVLWGHTLATMYGIARDKN